MSSADNRDVRFYTDNIRTFVAVAEAGGLGRAARAMGLSQPSVSQQVARLETLIGHRLFKRRRSGVSLTPDGAILLRHAEAMIDVNEAIRRDFHLSGRPVRLDLGLSEMFSLTSLNRILWLVAKQNPDLALRIVLGRSDTLRQGFADGQFDIAVCDLLTASPPAEFLVRQPLGWIGRADAACPVPDPIPLILPLAPSPLRTAMLDALETAGRTWTGVFEVSSVSVAEAAIEAGFGFCVALRDMPVRGAVHLDARSGLPDLPSLDYYMHRRDERSSDIVQAFCKLLRDAVAPGSAPSDAEGP